jgi:hypothetical protein
MTLSSVSPDNTGIAPANPVQSANELAFRTLIANAINASNTVVNGNTLVIDTIQTTNYIRNFDVAQLSTSANTIVILANAVIAWNNSGLGTQVTGWPAKTFNTSSNPVEMANNFVGYLWIIWDGASVKDYAITGRLAPPTPNYSLLGFYTIDGSGVVSITYLLERFYEKTNSVWTYPQYFNDGILGSDKYPINYLDAGDITRINTTQISAPYFAGKNSLNTGDIDISTAQTVDIATVGANGMGQTANQTGTITVNSGTATVTGTGTSFTTVFNVGDVITTSGNQSRRITIVTSNTALTVESNWGSNETGVTFRRGGRAPYTEYYLHASENGNIARYFLSERLTNPDLATGYTRFRHTGWVVLLDSSSNIFIAYKSSDYSKTTDNLAAYATRAWVNFDGNTAANVSGTYSQSGTTVTVTVPNHNHKAGHGIYASITSGAAGSEYRRVASVVDANTFTYGATSSLTTSGNITLNRRAIKASGNIANVTGGINTGLYIINLLNSMPDANYCVHANATSNAHPFGLIACEMSEEPANGGARGVNRLAVYTGDNNSDLGVNASNISVIVTR